MISNTGIAVWISIIVLAVIGMFWAGCDTNVASKPEAEVIPPHCIEMLSRKCSAEVCIEVWEIDGCLYISNSAGGIVAVNRCVDGVTCK